MGEQLRVEEVSAAYIAMKLDLDVPAGFKKSEAGVIPEDWHTPKFGEICTLVNGRGFKPYEWDTDGLPIIRIQNLNGSDEFNYFKGHFNPKIFVERGQLLFAWSGSRGTSFGPHIWRGGDALLNYHTWKLVLKKSDVDSNFFFHSLKALTKKIEDSAHGASALVHTQKGEMEQFCVPLPPSTAEQTAIATALSDVDVLIEGLDQLITKKRNLKQATMQQLLTGKTRLPEFALREDGTPKGYKQSELGEIPEDWDVKQLGNLCELKSGLSITSARIREMGTYPCYGGNGLRGFTEQFTHNGSYPLIGRQGALCGNIQYVSGKFFASEHALVATTFHDVDAEWLSIYLEKMKLNQYSESSAQPGLSAEKLSLLRLVRPEKNEQTAIASILAGMDAEINSIEQRRNKTQLLKQGMMQELLTGKTRLIKPELTYGQ